MKLSYKIYPVIKIDQNLNSKIAILLDKEDSLQKRLDLCQELEDKLKLMPRNSIMPAVQFIDFWACLFYVNVFFGKGFKLKGMLGDNNTVWLKAVVLPVPEKSHDVLYGWIEQTKRELIKLKHN